MNKIKLSNVIITAGRIIGFIILVGSLFLFVHSLGILLNADATIKFNGVPTSHLFIKLFATVIPFLGAVVGAFCAFAPRKIQEKIFIPKILRGG